LEESPLGLVGETAVSDDDVARAGVGEQAVPEAGRAGEATCDARVDGRRPFRIAPARGRPRVVPARTSAGMVI
jgi:hypothetical protein